MQNKPQLFCFTYAGGTAAFFDIIEDNLNGIDVVKLEYAGHGERHKERFYQDFDELANDMIQKLQSAYKGAKYALFGYSMGSITVAEVLKRIIFSDMPKPCYIFLAAHEPHSWAELPDCSDEEMDFWVKDRTIQFGAIPEKLINNKAFWRMYLPIYREDYKIIGKYDFENLDLKTQLPATIFYSEADTPLVKMKLWEKYFTGKIDFQKYDGKHFFIQDHYSEMAEVIKGRLGV